MGLGSVRNDDSIINGLARVDGARDTKPQSNGNLMLGNLELIFDPAEKLVRLRIHEGHASRDYVVRAPQENLSV